MRTNKLIITILLTTIGCEQITTPVTIEQKQPESTQQANSQPTQEEQAAVTLSNPTAKLDVEGYQYISESIYLYRHASNDPSLFGPNRTNDKLCLHNEVNGQILADFCWTIKTSPGSATWGNYQASGPSSWTHTVNTSDGVNNYTVTLNGLWQIQ